MGTVVSLRTSSDQASAAAVDRPAGAGCNRNRSGETGGSTRSEKLYLDALDYYRAAMAKRPNSASLLNKIGITELMMQRYREARKSFDQSVKTDRKFADAYNNRGVVLYEEKKYGSAVKEYRRAIALDGASASFFSNLGAALFAKREFEPAVIAYQRWGWNSIRTCLNGLRAAACRRSCPAPEIVRITTTRWRSSMPKWVTPTVRSNI